MPRPTEATVVRHPEAPVMVTLDPGVDYPADDILVRTYPWAFAKREAESGVTEAVKIETATAAPGEKRTRSRRS